MRVRVGDVLLTEELRLLEAAAVLLLLLLLLLLLRCCTAAHRVTISKLARLLDSSHSQNSSYLVTCDV